MKINNILDRLSVYETRKGEKGQEPKASTRTQGKTNRPIAEISDEARLIQRVRQILDQMPDVRPEVEELMKELEEKLNSGTYLEEVSGEDIIEQIKLELDEGN
jgi:hypothetical protein